MSPERLQSGLSSQTEANLERLGIYNSQLFRDTG